MNLTQLTTKLSIRFEYLIVISIVIAAAAGILVKTFDKNLITNHTPNGMLSLHLVRNAGDASAVKNVWYESADGEQRLNAAIHSLYADFLFIMSYGALLFLIFMWERTQPNALGNYIFLLPLSVILIDIAENILCILFLKNLIAWTWGMRLISLLKYWLFILNIFFMKGSLRKISAYAKDILALILRFRIVVISLLVMYFVLWKSDQGQDLVVSLNTEDWGVVVFFVVISITALLHWHIPKFLSKNTTLYVNGTWVPKTIGDWMRALFFGSVTFNSVPAQKIIYVTDSDLARTFGVLTFLIPAFGVMNVIDIFSTRELYSGLQLTAVTVFLLFVLDENWIDNAFQKTSWRWMFYLYFLITGIALVVFGILNEGSPAHLWYLFTTLVLLAGAFLIVVSIRKNIPLPIQNVRVSPLIMYLTVGLAILFIYFNIDPISLAANTKVNYATYAIFFAAIVFYCLLFLFLILWGRATTKTNEEGRETRVNIAAIVIGASIFAAILFDNRFHDVNLVDKGIGAEVPIPLRVYIENWLKDPKRKAVINTYSEEQPYPIIIVNAYGGGIRAAAWTSLAIAHLDSAVSKYTDEQEYFQDHVFAYSGASGGTIGASVMVALRKRSNQLPAIDSLINFYRKDYLSPVIVGLLGRDFWASTFGANWTDRARYQDLIWENHMKVSFPHSAYDAPLTSIWDDSYTVPLLFANTTHVEAGVKGIVAPVELDANDFPAAVQVMEKIYYEDNVRAEGMKLNNASANEKVLRTPKTLKLSTAAFMSARFPFISPAGRVDAEHHFLDGGIVENSGAETALEIARVFEICLDSATKKKVNIVILSLNSSPPNNPREAAKNLFEFSAPIQALVANVDGNAIHADDVNKMIFGQHYFKIKPKAITETDTSNTAILPLGWQLSEQALKRLNRNLRTDSARHVMMRLVSRFKK